jgi:hypothetical protein
MNREEFQHIWRQVEIANYITQCDDALQAELERGNGDWPDWLIVPRMPQSNNLRAAFAHWLDEIREKSPKPIRIYFERPTTA